MNKTFDTIYTKDTLGNIRIWYMEQNGNKYRTISGLSDGEKVTSEWSHAEAKNVGRSNETTSIEQATGGVCSVSSTAIVASLPRTVFLLVRVRST